MPFWTEVNVTPNIPADPSAFAELHTKLLVEVIDPLVHDEFDGDFATWHFFFEEGPTLRG